MAEEDFPVVTSLQLGLGDVAEEDQMIADERMPGTIGWQPLPEGPDGSMPDMECVQSATVSTAARLQRQKNSKIGKILLAGLPTSA